MIVKVTMDADLIEDRDGALLLVLKTGFGDPVQRVVKDKVVVVPVGV